MGINMWWMKKQAGTWRFKLLLRDFESQMPQ